MNATMDYAMAQPSAAAQQQPGKKGGKRKAAASSKGGSKDSDSMSVNAPIFLRVSSGLFGLATADMTAAFLLLPSLST